MTLTPPIVPVHDRFGHDLDNGFLTVSDPAHGPQLVLLVHRRPAHRCVSTLEHLSFDDALDERPGLTSYRATVNLVEAIVPDERSRLALQEFLGACLFGQGAKLGEAFVLAGPRGSGKTMLLDLFVSLLGGHERGAPYVTHVPPHAFLQQGVLTALAPVLLNTLDGWSYASGAFPSAPMIYTVLARLIQGQPATEGHSVRPKAGHLFATNDLPDDVTTLPFPARVVRTAGHASAFDLPRLHDVAASSSGLLLWAVRGYDRLLLQGHYTTPDAAVPSAASEST